MRIRSRTELIKGIVVFIICPLLGFGLLYLLGAILADQINSKSPPTLIIGTVLLIVVIFAGAFITFSIINQRVYAKELHKIQHLLISTNLAAQSNTASSNIETIIDEKKQKFLKIPSISFYFANKAQIRAFYDDYFKELNLESLVSEISSERTKGIKGSIRQFVEAQFGGNDINKIVSTFKLPDATENSMFLRYQREIIKRGEVALGIEEVDIELTELQTFNETVEYLKKQFGFEIDVAKLDNQRNRLKEKAAERPLRKLQQIIGCVLIEGKFKIELEGGFYRCTYQHPVNAFLSNQVSPITISVLIPLDSLEENIKGNFKQSVNRSIHLNIYGKVWQPLDRQAKIWDLQLTPIAIY